MRAHEAWGTLRGRPAPDQTLSAYELLRLENIRTNNQVLAAIGLADEPQRVPPAKKPKHAQHEQVQRTRPLSTRHAEWRAEDDARLLEKALMNTRLQGGWVWSFGLWLSTARSQIGRPNRQRMVACVQRLSVGDPVDIGDNEPAFQLAAPLQLHATPSKVDEALQCIPQTAGMPRQARMLRSTLEILSDFEQARVVPPAASLTSAFDSNSWRTEGHNWIGSNIRVFIGLRWVAMIITAWLEAGNFPTEPALWRASDGGEQTVELEAWEVMGGHWAMGGSKAELYAGCVVWARTLQYPHYWPCLICDVPATCGERGVLVYVAQRAMFVWADGVCLWDEGIRQGFADDVDTVEGRAPQRHKAALKLAIKEACDVLTATEREEGEIDE